MHRSGGFSRFIRLKRTSFAKSKTIAAIQFFSACPRVVDFEGMAVASRCLHLAGVTGILGVPGETEVGSAGKQPTKGGSRSGYAKGVSRLTAGLACRQHLFELEW